MKEDVRSEERKREGGKKNRKGRGEKRRRKTFWGGGWERARVRYCMREKRRLLTRISGANRTGSMSERLGR